MEIHNDDNILDNIQQLILDTYTAKPKHFTQMLKRNNEVLNYLKKYCSHIDSFLEQLYFAVYRQSNLCDKGNVRPLKTFAGYTFCGKAGVCQCAKESVSASVSKTKLLCTKEEKDITNAVRVKTNMERYGISNTGQTVDAKANHAAFYNDITKVDAVTIAIKETKLKNHNDENYNNRNKCEKTCLEKYGVKNTWSLSKEKQNPALDILRDKERLNKIFPKMSVQEIAETYKLHQQTVYWYLNKHNLR